MPGGTGGAPVWTTPAYDAELGLLFIGTGNPAPDYDGSVRPGDNLYSTSLVALEEATGKLRWYHQFVPHDVWDLDAASPPVVVREGGRKVVVEAGKTGWVYMLDAATGQLVRRSQAIVPQEQLFVPSTAEGTYHAPGPAGAVAWAPIAYSQQTDFVYVLGSHFPFVVAAQPTPYQAGRPWLGGTEQGLADSSWGTVSAVSVATGRITWAVKTENRHEGGGALATGGGLVFAGEGDGWFQAFDARSGRLLWRFFCGAGVNAPPIAFALDGEEMIAVAAGGSYYGFGFGDAVFVFALRKRD